MEIECKICCNNFDLGEYEPMILQCGHTLCKSCTADYNKCPFDRQTFNKGALKKNFELIGMLENQKNDPLFANYGKCPAHKQKITMICLEHMQELCPNCFLKNHNGHNVKEFGDFKDELENFKSKFKEMENLASKSKHFDYASEKNGLMKLMLEERENVKKLIKNELDKICNLFNECGKKIFAEIDRIFAANERIIGHHLNNKQTLVNASQGVLDRFKQSIDYFRDLDKVKLNKESIEKMIVSKRIMPDISAFQEQLKQIDQNFQFSSTGPHLAEKVFAIFKEIHLFNPKLFSEMFDKFDLLDGLSKQASKGVPNKIRIENSDRTLKANDVQFLASFIAAPDQYKIDKKIENGSESFIVDFKTKEQSIYFVLFDGMLVGKSKLKMHFESPVIQNKTEKIIHESDSDSDYY